MTVETLHAKDILTTISKTASDMGADVRPYESAEQIVNLSPEKVKGLINQIGIYDDILKETKSKDPKSLDKEMLEKAFEKLGLTPADDIGPYVNGQDIVEIYTPEGTQLYRNLVFLKYCSYDLASLYTVPHQELYGRNENMLGEIGAVFQKAFTAEKIVPFNMEPHLIWETYLHNRKRFQIDLKIACPLKDSEGNTKAILTTNHCTEFKIHQVN